MTEVTLRLSNATIEGFTAAYGEKHWQRKAAQLRRHYSALQGRRPDETEGA